MPDDTNRQNVVRSQNCWIILILYYGYIGRGANEIEFNGIEVPFLSIDDLIVNKKAVARPKDQIDVIELEKIKKIQQEEDK